MSESSDLAMQLQEGLKCRQELPLSQLRKSMEERRIGKSFSSVMRVENIVHEEQPSIDIREKVSEISLNPLPQPAGQRSGV